MPSSENRTYKELEAATAYVIGKTVLALSELEFNIGLYLRNAVGGQDPEGANAIVTRLNLKSKVDALQEIVGHKFREKTDALNELRPWLKAMDNFRVKRNVFVHGRWGFIQHSQEVVNVVPGLPSTLPQKEIRYTVEELEDALRDIKQLSSDFIKWSGKWPL